MSTREFTPEYITELAANEIFVFGSNLMGRHGGGAARVAMDKFGAIWGVGVGLQGQSYAIPTMQGGVETIKPYVDQFIEFAKNRPDLKFLVTPIGCGIAGFTVEEIAPLFKAALAVENVVLPKSFVDVLGPVESAASVGSAAAGAATGDAAGVDNAAGSARSDMLKRRRGWLGIKSAVESHNLGGSSEPLIDVDAPNGWNR